MPSQQTYNNYYCTIMIKSFKLSKASYIMTLCIKFLIVFYQEFYIILLRVANRGQACCSVHNVAAKIIIVLTEWWILITISNILSPEFIH